MQKILKIILNTFFSCIVATFLVLILCSITKIEPNIVLSGSMEPSIKTGSLAFVNKTTDYDDIEVGDVIAYKAGGKALVTHRVINIVDGMFETKGDNNEHSDGISVDESNFYGKTLLSIPYLGYLFAWIQTKKGTILSVTIVCAAFILEYAIGGNDNKDKKKDDKKDDTLEEE